MRIVEINAYEDGSTGRIMMHIANYARRLGHHVDTFSTNVFSTSGLKLRPAIEGHSYFSSYFENMIHYIMAQFTDGNGLYSTVATFRLIRRLKKIKPDILQLHNLHEFCINVPQLLRYIEKNKVNTVWTFHDCWAFTGHCMHFDNAKCEKWINGCSNCPQKYVNPRSRVDRSALMWKKKRDALSNVKTLTIVTPSEWLEELTRRSFLRGMPIQVINNGIDTSIFLPRSSDFRDRYNLDDKYIALGVASDWSYLKGLDIFIKLAKELDERFVVVLVGVSAVLELPANIIGISRTNNQMELAEIYSAADIFVNPTREDTFPTVNIEALACGTPVITFRTGGSPEIINEKCGMAVDKDDYDALKRGIIETCEGKPFESGSCVEHASQYTSEKCYSKYIALYEQIIEGANE